LAQAPAGQDAGMTEERREPQDMAPADEAPAGAESTGADVCPRCVGSGVVDGEDCPECKGTGQVIEGVGGG
jgi:RecJ-like exonuclease